MPWLSHSSGVMLITSVTALDSSLLLLRTQTSRRQLSLWTQPLLQTLTTLLDTRVLVEQRHLGKG